MATVDPVTLEIVNNRLRFISREMIVSLVRTAYSSVIYDGRDCSCALFNAAGELLTLDAGLPAHIGPMPFSMRAILKKFQNSIKPGDVFIMNDPSFGGNHLPDVLVCMPIFYQEEPLFFAVNRGHWTDVGGQVPGSLSGVAREIYQEGMVIPPLKLYEAGKINEGVLDLFLSNMRNREERFGDLMSQIASCKTGEKSCLELVEHYGFETIKTCGQEIVDRTEKYLLEKLKQAPKGTYHYEDYLDNDGFTHDALRVKVCVTIHSDSVLIDFDGSSPQSQGCINAPYSVTYCGAVEAIKIALDPRGVTNEGLFRLVKVNAPLGSLVNPNPGAATGGCTEVFFRVAFCVIGALANAMPDAVSGGDYGTVNHSYISGFDKSSNKHFIYYEFPAGGNGGTFIMDGPSAMRSPISGDVYLSSHELVESLYPVIIDQFSLRTDSGGAGKFRGGLGIIRQVRVLADEAALSVVADRNKIPPFGIFGGHAPLSQQWNMIRDRETEKPLSSTGKVTGLPLKKGDTISLRSAGGGGYGNPLDRDPDKVRNDVYQGYVTIEAARNVYGVVFKHENLLVEIKATENQRKILRDKQQLFVSKGYGTPIFTQGIKAVMLNREESKRFRSGELVEVFNDQIAAPYRAKIVFRSIVNPGHALIDDETQQMIGIKDGDLIQITSLSAKHQVGIARL